MRDSKLYLNDIIEKLLFSQSDATIGIQIADLYCYPVFNIFESNKTKDEYWRFRELSFPKLYSKNGKSFNRSFFDGRGFCPATNLILSYMDNFCSAGG